VGEAQSVPLFELLEFVIEIAVRLKNTNHEVGSEFLIPQRIPGWLFLSKHTARKKQERDQVFHFLISFVKV